MAESILGEGLGEGDTIILTYDEEKKAGELSFKIKKGKKPKKDTEARTAPNGEEAGDATPDASTPQASAEGDSGDKSPETAKESAEES